MKKKILFIMSTNDYSGAEAVNFNIINSLKEKFDFYWVSKKGNINKFLDENNIKWIEIKELNVKELSRVIRIYQPSILHATDFKASCISSIFGKKIPVIAHLHHNNPWIKKINLKSILFLICSKHINKILTVSPAIENEYIFSKNIKEKIKCISNPVSRENILKKVSNQDYVKIYDICCTARITNVKRPFMFLEIIKKLKKDNNNVKAIWIGNGDLKEKCIEKSKEMGLENNIEFIGFQKNPYKYMAHSKLFMLTSSFEGFGLSAFEALTLGLPCIVSNVGGLKAVVNGECGKVCDNENDFYQASSILLKDELKYKKMCKNAIERSIELDNSNEYINNIETIYQKVN